MNTQVPQSSPTDIKVDAEDWHVSVEEHPKSGLYSPDMFDPVGYRESTRNRIVMILLIQQFVVVLAIVGAIWSSSLTDSDMQQLLGLLAAVTAASTIAVRWYFAQEK